LYEFDDGAHVSLKLLCSLVLCTSVVLRAGSMVSLILGVGGEVNLANASWLVFRCSPWAGVWCSIAAAGPLSGVKEGRLQGPRETLFTVRRLHIHGTVGAQP
jgi:hypothetical protein